MSAVLAKTPSGVVADVLGPEFGVEVKGLDLARLADHRNEQGIAWLQGLLDTKLLILFRGVKLTQTQLATLVGYFGPLAPVRTQGSSHQVAEGIKLITNERDETGKALGDPPPYELGWHTDGSYMRRPVGYTALYCVAAPTVNPTRTYFMSMDTTFRRMPLERQRELEAMTVLHYSPKNPTRYAPEGAPLVGSCRAVEHPLVRQLPSTGKVAIFLGAVPDCPIVYQDERWSQSRSAQFVAELCALGTELGQTWDTALQADDLVFWDNRVIAHRRDNIALDVHRVLWHVAVQGDDVVPFEGGQRADG